MQGSALQGGRPSSGNGVEGAASVEGQNETMKAIAIEIGSKYGGPVAFVGDAGYVVGGDGNEIRCWRVNDGKEVGQPMDAGSEVWSIAVSRDGKWIVSGTRSGQVVVWDAESREKASVFKGHGRNYVLFAVDISPDATRVASGSDDKTVRVWSRSTGQQLLGPFKHDSGVAAVKFSPDGQFIATAATWFCESVRIYDSHDGRLLFDCPVKVGSHHNQSLAWVRDSKHLFALTHDGKVHYLDVTNGRILSVWGIHSNDDPRCLALASNGAFIAASAHSSVSFWDTATHMQIGSLIHHPLAVWHMAISANDDLVLSHGSKIILRKLPDILPSSYFDNVGVFRCQRDPIHRDSLAATDTQSHLSVG